MTGAGARDETHPLAPGGRTAAMAERVATAARRAGLGEDGIALALRAFRAAMQPRIARLSDDHHPDYLHPGRTALILLEDLGVVDPATLAAGILAETLHPELAAAGFDGEGEAVQRTRDLLAQVPLPAREGDELLERLLAAEPAARLVALAERLDHARHLHLRPAEAWAPLHHETCAVYRPVAERLHDLLARRFGWWCDTFRRRFLAGARDGD